MNYQKDKLGKNPIYYSNKKNKVPRNKFNQGGKRPIVRNYREKSFFLMSSSWRKIWGRVWGKSLGRTLNNKDTVKVTNTVCVKV